ncbi:MAG: LPS export ABC transporter permease LptG [Desulfamplus sp.]|nr:LPS export ABC transporter permease LptG [Desulfamplus sp.]
MSILTQYWIKEFSRFFLIIQTIVMSIFISVDYLTNLDKFLKSGISLISALGYVLLKTPFMFVQLTPAGIILAVVTVFGLMNRNNELLAIRAGGISTYYMVMPAVITGISLGLLMFFLGETVVPLTMSKANHIKYSVIKKNRNVYAVRENIWIKGDSSIYHFRYFNPTDKTIAGITITFLDKNFKISKRVDADNGQFQENKNLKTNEADTTIRQSKNSKWLLYRVLEQTFDKKIQDFIIKEYDQKEIGLELNPDDLKAVVKKAEEMDFRELAAHIKKVENEGYDATTYKVDLFGKTAFPFICVIMSIIGAATGMRRFVKENLAFGITIGIIASFLYWIVYGFSTSLGYARMLPPFVSAWSANFLFLCGALIYLLNSE